MYHVRITIVQFHMNEQRRGKLEKTKVEERNWKATRMCSWHSGGDHRVIIYRVYGVRSTARAAEGTAPLRTRACKSSCCQVWTEKALLFTILPRTIQPTFLAYVCVYCWPVVAFSGPIISRWNNEFRSECFSREVNVHLFKVIRTSTTLVTANEGTTAPSGVNASRWNFRTWIISSSLLFCKPRSRIEERVEYPPGWR